MTLWNFINIFIAYVCWEMADNFEPFSGTWWFNVIASAANAASVAAVIF